MGEADDRFNPNVPGGDMLRTLTTILACTLALTVLFAASACSNQGQESAAAPQESAAKDYPLLDLDGYKGLIQDSAGKVLLVCIWSVNCPACQQELPVLEQLADSHDPDKLRVVYASLDPASRTISDFFGDYQPVAEVVRVGNDVAAFTGSEYIPRLIVYSTTGEVSFIDSGFYPAAMLDALLKRAGLE
jgi:thiol-disulfide isomerase/thioredoxin